MFWSLPELPERWQWRNCLLLHYNQRCPIRSSVNEQIWPPTIWLSALASSKSWDRQNCSFICLGLPHLNFFVRCFGCNHIRYHGDKEPSVLNPCNNAEISVTEQEGGITPYTAYQLNLYWWVQSLRLCCLAIFCSDWILPVQYYTKIMLYVQSNTPPTSGWVGCLIAFATNVYPKQFEHLN